MVDPIQNPSRRAAFAGTAIAAVGLALLLPGCSDGDDEGEDVSATEDLMREHGVLRRILVLYRETARIIRANPAVDVRPLVAAADLFRLFGEDYHEKKLEEAHVFPVVKQAGGPAAGFVDTLVEQHNRGREINGFVTVRCRGGRLASGDVEPVARALESFARMYEKHAAIEDTVVFQAWKKTMSRKQLDDIGDKFEDIEHRQFNGDGFDLGVDRVTAIERAMGLYDIAQFTAPAPSQ
jgi:hemerythrin-like domain-containing protein